MCHQHPCWRKHTLCRLVKGTRHFTAICWITVIIKLHICGCSAPKSCPVLFDPADCSAPGFHVLRYLPEFVQIHVHWVSDSTYHLILCHPLLLPSTFPSIRVFSSELALPIRWPKYWSFSFSNNLSNEYSGLIPFRNNWFGLLVVQGTLKSLLQHHNSKASLLRHSAFFMVQLSHPCLTAGKNIALTRRIFVGKGMSLLFNTLSRFVMAFLQRNKRLV